MKRTLIIMMLASTFLGACSSNPLGMRQAQGNETPVADQVITTEYKDQGVVLHYTLLGNLKSIEIYGQAAAWKSNPAILAEADAKEKLVKFVFGEQVDSNRSVQILAKSIENSRDNALNSIENNFTSEQLAAEVQDDEAAGAQEDNTSRRIATRLDETIANTITTIVASGRLVGVRKQGDKVIDDGRLYVAKYVWSEDDAEIAADIRKTMALY